MGIRDDGGLPMQCMICKTTGHVRSDMDLCEGCTRLLCVDCTRSDSEGIPLCHECYQDLVDEARKEQADAK